LPVVAPLKHMRKLAFAFGVLATLAALMLLRQFTGA
jgi:hypothetical protein